MAVSSICVHHIPCLVTCDPGREGLGKIYDASVVFSSDNIIRYVGRADEAPVDTADKVLDLSVLRGGYVGLPGLVDCHTHSVFAGSRSAEFAERLRGVPYVEILQRGGGILSTVSATRVASKEELTASARARINQFVRNGCTTCEIKSGYGLSVEAEKKILEVVDTLREESNRGVRSLPRVVPTFLAHTIPSEFRDAREKYVNQVITEQLPACVNLAEHMDIFVDKGAFTLEEGMRILDAGKRQGLLVKAHAEQIEFTGCAKLVADLKGVSADHLERLDREGAEAMGKNNVVATMLPGAQFYLKDISPPVSLLREHSVKMAVATDLNPGSSPVFDLLQCATMSCVIQGLTSEEAILGITRHGGLALGNSKLGWLGSDSVADMAIFRVPPGEAAEVESLVQYSGGYECVLVIRGGRIIHMGADIGESSFALRGVLCKKILTRSKESMFKQKLKAVLQRKLRVLGE